LFGKKKPPRGLGKKGGFNPFLDNKQNPRIKNIPLLVG